LPSVKDIEEDSQSYRSLKNLDLFKNLDSPKGKSEVRTAKESVQTGRKQRAGAGNVSEKKMLVQEVSHIPSPRRKIVVEAPRDPKEITHEIYFGNLKKTDPAQYERQQTENQLVSEDMKREVQLHQQYSSQREGRRRHVHPGNLMQNEYSSTAYTGKTGYSASNATKRTAAEYGSAIVQEDWINTTDATCVTGLQCGKNDQPFTKIGHENRLDQRVRVHRGSMNSH